MASHFVADRAVLTRTAERALVAHRWPGNVRELKNSIERAVLLCRDGRIDAADFALSSVGGGPAADPVEHDAEAIETALAHPGGNISQAAVELGLSRQALYRRIEKLGIAPRGGE